MKKIIITSVLLFIASISFCQQKSDTLIVPVDKYQFIKIGDKVYKINYLLEEVQPTSPILKGAAPWWPGGPIQTLPGGETPAIWYYPNEWVIDSLFIPKSKSILYNKMIPL